MSADNKGLWIDRVDPVTGEHSLKEHELKLVWKSCKAGKHDFKISGNRELKCKRCGLIRQFIPGRDNNFLKKQGIK